MSCKLAHCPAHCLTLRMASALRFTSSDTGCGDETVKLGVRGLKAGRLDAEPGDPGGNEPVRGTYAERTAVADIVAERRLLEWCCADAAGSEGIELVVGGGGECGRLAGGPEEGACGCGVSQWRLGCVMHLGRCVGGQWRDLGRGRVV
jgi:hypothetical protein